MDAYNESTKVAVPVPSFQCWLSISYTSVAQVKAKILKDHHVFKKNMMVFSKLIFNTFISLIYRMNHFLVDSSELSS